MVIKNFTFSIIIQSIALIFTGFISAYFIFGSYNLFVAILVFCFIIPEILYLIYTINRISRTLSFFFESVQNDDTSLKFPTKVGNKMLGRLHNSLNRINHLIREAKMQNESNERFYHTLIEQSASGLISVNDKGQFEIISNKAKQFLGVKHTSSLQALQHQNYKLYKIFNEIKGGENKTVRIHYNNEILLLLIKASEIRYENKRVKLLSLDNIKQELDEKELDSWQKLIRVLTHEIMNSVAPITSLTNSLLELYSDKGIVIGSANLSEKTISHTVNGLEVIKERGDGLISFVENYRSLTKIPKPVFSKLNLSDWTENIKILLSERIHNNNIDLQINIEKNIEEIQVDERLFTQVMINLLNNSIDALENIADKKISIIIESTTTEKVVIKVIDNGCGMSNDILEKIFIPFYTTKEEGSGIGLSLSRQIIILHNGNFSVYSKENLGATFIITLNTPLKLIKGA